MTKAELLRAAIDLAKKGDHLAVLYLIRVLAPKAMLAYSKERFR
jgi:hypothetical protein